MDENIKRILDKYTYPIINSLIYPNGEMLVLESYKINNKHILRTLCKSTIDSYFYFNDINCVSYLSVAVSEENEFYSVFAGGGSMGGDGFVFLLDKSDSVPLWFFFLDNSDPFEKISFETQEVIIAHSSSDFKIRIPIKKPHLMKIIQ